MRKSTGKDKIVAYMVRGNYIKKKPDRETCPVKEKDMEVFGSSRGVKPRTPRSKAEYDFAAVYFREKLCYDVLTEYGTISEGFQKIKRIHAP